MVETILFILLIGAIIYFGFFWEDADEKEVKKAKKKEVDDFVKERKQQDKDRVNTLSQSYLDHRPPGYHPKWAVDYPRKEKPVKRANDYSDDLPTIIPYAVGDDDNSSSTHSPNSKDESSTHSITLGGGHFGGGGASGGWSYNDHGSSSHSTYSSHSDHSSYSDHSSSSYDFGSSDSGSCDSGGGDCGGCD